MKVTEDSALQALYCADAKIDDLQKALAAVSDLLMIAASYAPEYGAGASGLSAVSRELSYIQGRVRANWQDEYL